MGSTPDLLELLPFVNLITAIDAMIPNLFGSIGGSLGVEVAAPEIG